MTMPAESTVPVLEFRRKAETTKFCRDCRWWDGKQFARCLALQNFRTRVSLVTGETQHIPYQEYCEIQRTTGVSENRCGEEGRWFEPRTDEITCHYDDSTAGNPTREFDYVVYRDPEGLSGRGATREAAIADLIEKEGEQ